LGASNFGAATWNLGIGIPPPAPGAPAGGAVPEPALSGDALGARIICVYSLGTVGPDGAAGAAGKDAGRNAPVAPLPIENGGAGVPA
jgi:hypothetical protein